MCRREESATHTHAYALDAALPPFVILGPFTRASACSRRLGQLLGDPVLEPDENKR